MRGSADFEEAFCATAGRTSAFTKYRFSMDDFPYLNFLLALLWWRTGARVTDEATSMEPKV